VSEARSAKQRADHLLVERGLAPTRTQARALLMAGRVFSGERRVDKAGMLLRSDSALELRDAPRFVSRGGDKLDGALDDLAVDVAGAICADVGASTGGFTDCLLQRGAAKVYAIDVGHGQLHPRLRADPRVVTMEGINARSLRLEHFTEALTLVVVDASFIGIDKLLPAIFGLLPHGGRLIALIKPQFEAGREEARRGRGVIRDPAVRQHAIASALSAIEAAGFTLGPSADSRLAGPKGNLEHFVLAERPPPSEHEHPDVVERVRPDRGRKASIRVDGREHEPTDPAKDE
jgi:23S rRNA (cytidine1920-2'-O)/16S rRNA (cytidine1409-2'-O)-methyltransferase